MIYMKVQDAAMRPVCSITSVSFQLYTRLTSSVPLWCVSHYNITCESSSSDRLYTKYVDKYEERWVTVCDCHLVFLS